MSTVADTIVAGEELLLSPERAAFWPRRAMLLIADPHFGKAASFRALGVRAPAGTTAESLARMDRLIETHAPGRIVFLGDFLHAKEGRTAATFASLAEWRQKHSAVEMQLVRGNHDRRAGDPPAEVGITCVDAPLIDAPFALAHHPVVTPGHFTLAGHIHPCAVLTGKARQRERLPCFWFGATVGVLPAFGEFTGCAEVSGEETDELWVIANDEVCRVNRA